MTDIVLKINQDTAAFILTQVPDAPSFTLNGTTTGDIAIDLDSQPVGQVALKGPKGDKGEQGEPGETLLTDPGDLTLIFENKLI